MLVVWNDATRERNELFADRVVQRIVPVYPRQNVWCYSDGHGSQFGGGHGIFDESFFVRDLAQQRICCRA